LPANLGAGARNEAQGAIPVGNEDGFEIDGKLRIFQNDARVAVVADAGGREIWLLMITVRWSMTNPLLCASGWVRMLAVKSMRSRW
jgi:hypothetical protein